IQDRSERTGAQLAGGDALDQMVQPDVVAVQAETAAGGTEAPGCRARWSPLVEVDDEAQAPIHVWCKHQGIGAELERALHRVDLRRTHALRPAGGEHAALEKLALHATMPIRRRIEAHPRAGQAGGFGIGQEPAGVGPQAGWYS